MATILVVESDSHLARLVAMAASNAGHAAVSVPDATTALAALGSLKFDGFVVGATLSGLINGVELMEIARRTLGYTRAPFIVLTDDRTSESAERARRVGAAGLLRKPCAPREVLLALEAVWPTRVAGLRTARPRLAGP